MFSPFLDLPGEAAISGSGFGTYLVWSFSASVGVLAADFSDGDRSFQIYRDRSRWVFEGCLIVHAAVTPLYLFQ